MNERGDNVKRGIALSGGGARGAYQVGVLRALGDHGLLDNVHAISGSSVGSLNACLLAMNNLDKAEELWLSLDDDAVFDTDVKWGGMLKENVNLLEKGILQTDKLEAMVEETIDFDTVRKHNVYVAVSHVGDEQSGLFDVLTINIRNFFEKNKHIYYAPLKELSNAEIKKILLASCAIPVIFKPVKFEGKTYYDGGVLDNTPYQPLIDRGCEEIIVIDLFRINLDRKKQIKDTKMHYIHPSRYLGRIMDFSSDKIKNRFDLGYEDGLKFVEKYKEQ